MNALDRLIASVAPVHALRRVAARHAIAGFEARSTGLARDLSTSRRAYQSPNAATPFNSLADRRGRSRRLVAENCWAGAIIDRMVSKIVGAGIGPRQWKPLGVVAQKQWVDDWWTFWLGCDFAARHTFGGLQSLVARTVAVSGGCLVQLVTGPATETVPPLRLRVYEPDYLALDRTENATKKGRKTVQGVEFDGDGRIIGYHIHPVHPAEGPSDPEYVKHGDWLYVTRPDRPGQVHGWPWLFRAEQRLRDLDEIDEARLIAEKIQACFAGFRVRGLDGTTTPLGLVGQEQGEVVSTIVPGTITDLGVGQDIKFATPPAADGAREAITILRLHEIAAGCGLPYSMATGDLRQANYSSLRVGQIDFHQHLDGWQEWLVHQFCRPVYAAWTRAMTLSGKRQAKYPADCQWDVPRRPLLDPEKEGNALDAALATGRLTLDQVVSADGKDLDEHLDELKKVADGLAKRDLALAGIPGAPRPMEDPVGG